MIVNGDDLQRTLQTRSFDTDLFLRGIDELASIEELLKRTHIDFSDIMNVLKFDLALHKAIRRLVDITPAASNTEAQ